LQTLFAAVFIYVFIYIYTQTLSHSYPHITGPAVANREFCKSHTVQHSKVCIVFPQQL